MIAEIEIHHWITENMFTLTIETNKRQTSHELEKEKAETLIEMLGLTCTDKNNEFKTYN